MTHPQTALSMIEEQRRHLADDHDLDYRDSPSLTKDRRLERLDQAHRDHHMRAAHGQADVDHDHHGGS